MSDKPIHDVHTSHCCLLHGCKYGEDDICTVVTKKAKQEGLCESCGMEAEWYYDGFARNTNIAKDSN